MIDQYIHIRNAWPFLTMLFLTTIFGASQLFATSGLHLEDPTATCDLTITTTSNSITVGGLDAGHVILKLFNPDWSTNFQCLDNCSNPTTISSLAIGTYYLSVNLYDDNWQPICDQAEFVTVDGTGCVDNDNDGHCQPDDCNDNDPSIPTTPGTSCDDGDANTINDVIQSDGCTCAGTPIGGGCDVSWTTTATSITITGLNAPHVIFKLHHPNWSIHTECFDNCANPLTISGLTSEATYHLNYNLYDANWQPICSELVDVVISGSGGNEPDLSISNLQSDPSGSPGQVTNFTFDLNNFGDAVASGSYLIEAYISTDNQLSNDDVSAGEIPTGNTPIGTIPDVPGAITVPNLPQGDYYLIVKADANNNIAESNENNNTASVSYSIIGGGLSCGFEKTYGPFNFLANFTEASETSDEYQYVSYEPVQAGVQTVYTLRTDKDGNQIGVDTDQQTLPTLPTVTSSINGNFQLVVTSTTNGVENWSTIVTFDVPPGSNIIATNGDQVRTLNDGYLAAGTVIISGAQFEFHTYFIKFDLDGNLIQQNISEGLLGDFFILSNYFDVPGGAIFRLFQNTGSIYYFIKIDDNGAFLWLTPFVGDLPSNTLIQIGLSPDQQHVYALNVNNQRAFLDKISTDDGVPVYDVNLSGVFTPQNPGIFGHQTSGFFLTDDGGVLTGYTGEDLNLNQIFSSYGKLDANGNLVWDISFNEERRFQPLVETSDGGALWIDLDGTSSDQLKIVKTTNTGSLTPTCDGGGGTPLGCDLSYTTSGGDLSIFGPGLDASHVIIKVFSPSWSTIFNCFDDCGNSIDLSGLTAGTYHVSVALYNDSWVKTCDILEDVVVGSSTPLQGNDPSFLFFQAAKNGRTGHLSWVVNNNNSTDRFRIERSHDGLTYVALQSLDAIGGTDSEQAYQVEDRSPLPGMNFYRVVQFFDDGSMRYSREELLLFDLGLDEVAVFPNPASEVVHIQLKKLVDTPTEILIYNSFGQLMEQVSLAAGHEEVVSLATSDWPGGYYQVQVRTKDARWVNMPLIIGRM